MGGNVNSIDFGAIAIAANRLAKEAKENGEIGAMRYHYDVKAAALSLLIITAAGDALRLSWQQISPQNFSLLVSFSHSTGWRVLHSFINQLTVAAQREVTARIGRPSLRAPMANGQEEIAA